MPQYFMPVSFGSKYISHIDFTPPLNRGEEAGYMIIIQTQSALVPRAGLRFESYKSVVFQSRFHCKPL
jgi:hypothetical protein